MKTIGLIGGMSWESTLEYYRILNEVVKQKLGGYHSAKIMLYSVDFAEYERLMRQDDWGRIASLLGDAARKLESAGADLVTICTNTMHRVAEQVQEQITIPLLHIADATAEVICANGIQTIALLGTKTTMGHPFYRKRLEQHGIRVMTPNGDDADMIHRVIFEELCLGTISESSRLAFVQIICGMEAHGAEGVILGCTEIGLLIRPEDTRLPVFDTTKIHATKAAVFALESV